MVLNHLLLVLSPFMVRPGPSIAVTSGMDTCSRRRRRTMRNGSRGCWIVDTTKILLEKLKKGKANKSRRTEEEKTILLLEFFR
jgi:hypothetical protein